jgi:hypothetical protein
MNSIAHAQAVFNRPWSGRTEFVGKYLRGKSPDVVSKEILMHFLAYALLCALMWQAAETQHRPLHRLRFTGTMQHFEAVAPYLCLFAGTPKGAARYELLLSWIADDIIPDRPAAWNGHRMPSPADRSDVGLGLA